MSNYTPNEEQVREQYTREQPPQIGTAAEKAAEFERFIAKVKADALREAVEYFENLIGIGEFREETRRDGRHWVDPDRAWGEQGPFMDWLRNHADRIERGER